MITQTVTEEHLKPSGWKCEGCGHDFALGEEAFGNYIAFTDSTPRDFEGMMSPEARAEVEDWDAPIPILGDWRCRACFDADTPVSEGEGRQ